MGSKADMTSGGTFVPHNLTRRPKEAYVWIGMMPGMMGTLMPTEINPKW
jgi:hypothetical protein